MSKSVKPADAVENAQDYENEHVHAVYEQIASHFSSTRYKPWPIIAAFLNSLPTGWIGLDSGTGNGKYLHIRRGDVWTIGLDRSANLLSIAQTVGEVVRDDVLGHAFRDGIFDYAISIATIHHLATAERRRLAVQRLLEAVSPAHGRVLIYVWAVEQDELSKRQVTASDAFVPWVRDQTSYDRYYHFFAKGELKALVGEAAGQMGLELGSPVDGRRGLEIVQDGWERSNYYVELKRWNFIAQ